MITYLADKDAGDIYRLMQTTNTATFIAAIRTLLADQLAGDSTRVALTYVEEQFGACARPGVEMAVRAMDPAVPPERWKASMQRSCAKLAQPSISARPRNPPSAESSRICG